MNSLHVIYNSGKEQIMSDIDNLKHLSPEEFSMLDLSSVTLVDMREPDEVLTGGFESAINIPLSGGFAKLDTLPMDRLVVLVCAEGVLSEQVAEYLSDKGYDVASLDGGYKAYRAYLQEKEQEAAATEEKNISGDSDVPETHVLIDAKGLKCPGPIVKVADHLRDKPAGETVIVEATEDAFASDIRVWCDRTGNHLDELVIDNGLIRAKITRAYRNENTSVREQHDKTFVIFSGDLDKTIAAFIIANGAAAMGRKVTMFFTFWGLNILRRPNKVRTAKSLVERMFGVMMPRGTYRLGLSRMNMGGIGAKMIRAIMKQKGISLLEELMESAKEHGVRLVACQMSMDIMGIRREELIDGVELGGVATFIGSGELSDMSLFI